MTVTMRPTKEIYEMLVGLPVVRRGVLRVAEAIKAEAQSRLAMHRDTGAARVILNPDGKSGVYVELIDKAAVSIEFGAKNKRAGRFVPGLYIIHGAADNVKAGWKSHGFHVRSKKKAKRKR